MELLELVERYIGSRDLTRGYAEQLRTAARNMTRAGIELANQLTADRINEYLHASREAGCTQETRRSRRRMAITLADYAADHGHLVDFRRRSVMRIGARQKIPASWSVEQVRTLLLAAEALKGEYRNGISRAAYWSGFVRAAWDTGLRGVDLRSIEREWIPSSGRCLLVQHKTAKRIWIQFRPSTLAVIDSTFPPRRALAWPLWARLDRWRREARRLVARSGLTGSIGRLRHSCGTAVELAHPGRGHERLGNTRAVFEQHYYDARRAQDIEILLPVEL